MINSIGTFTLTKRSGSGAFGKGYRAINTETGDNVFVKVSSGNLSEQRKANFEAEYKIGQEGFDHPNLLRILGAGQ
jgi:serine/threonine protein kinase